MVQTIHRRVLSWLKDTMVFPRNIYHHGIHVARSLNTLDGRIIEKTSDQYQAENEFYEIAQQYGMPDEDIEHMHKLSKKF
jgi:hypothetical protein